MGKWDIVGGRINPGSTLVENLRREVTEETGLEVLGEPKLIAAQDILRIPGRHVVRLTFEAKADGRVRLDTDENMACEWLTIDEMKKKEDLDMYLKVVIEKHLV